ncbi:MAG: hypothetical protein QM811_17120 [Pirellulales bacterium]
MADVPPFRVIVITSKPAPKEVDANVCAVAPVALPAMPSAPPVMFNAEAELIRFVGVAKFANVSASVPLVIDVVPV